MSATASEGDDARRLAEASAWRATLTEADAETTPEFEDWIADPANEAAWDQVMASWMAVGDHAETSSLLAMRRDALHRARQSARQRWATGWRAAAAACFLALVGVGIFMGVAAWRADRPIEYATELGERRVVTLTDGSRISLDSGTEVRVRYSDEARDIDLVRGQARFDVAHDVTRRFLVHANDQTVVATGTAFNVDLSGRRVSVTLIEGSVVVLQSRAPRQRLAAPGGAQGVTLRTGQQLVVAPTAAPIVQTVSLERTTAWESGQLIFDDEPLSAIATRVNRYSAQQITVEPAVASLRVSGVFRTGDVPTFVDTVTRYLHIRATTNSDGSVVLKARSGPVSDPM